jgi:predicted nucleotidyltransferase
MNRVVTQVIHYFERQEIVESVRLYGSQLNPEQVDAWSDIDLEINISLSVTDIMAKLELLISNLGEVVAKEIIHQDDQVLFRLVMDINGLVELLDLSIKSSISSSFNSSTVDLFWWRLFLAAKKFKRKDFLIGGHLLLTCMQDILVLKMVERDHKKQTNIHRFGDQENIQNILGLTQFKLNNLPQIETYLLEIADTFDRMHLNQSNNYFARKSYLSTFINKAKS